MDKLVLKQAERCGKGSVDALMKYEVAIGECGRQRSLQLATAIRLGPRSLFWFLLLSFSCFFSLLCVRVALRAVVRASVCAFCLCSFLFSFSFFRVLLLRLLVAGSVH